MEIVKLLNSLELASWSSFLPTSVVSQLMRGRLLLSESLPPGR